MSTALASNSGCFLVRINTIVNLGLKLTLSGRRCGLLCLLDSRAFGHRAFYHSLRSLGSASHSVVEEHVSAYTLMNTCLVPIASRLGQCKA